MLFYILFPILLVLILATYLILKFTKFKNNEKFDNIMNKILKISVITYCVIVFLSVLLPDSFVLSISEEALGNGHSRGFAILRWFNALNFIVLPIAVFYKNRTFKKIAIYFNLLVSIISIFYYNNFIEVYTSAAGRGLNSISILSDGFKSFMINETFRAIVWGITLGLQILIPIILAFQEKHNFSFKNKKEYLYFFVILLCVIISGVPIYVPQYLFGYSDILFEMMTPAHIIWLVSVVAEMFILYFIFRNKDKESKMVLLMTMALCLIYQYFQMFGAISINIKRLPLQLCNIGSFLILICLITKNQKIFNFTIIINVVGAIIALALPDLDGEGLFYLYNMHFILEHTNVVVVPILALALGIFPRLNWKALRDCLVGFCIYFIAVYLLGTFFNSIAETTGNSFWYANYMFMFDKKVAVATLPFVEPLFNTTFSIGSWKFYPVIQSIIFAVFLVLCTLLFLVIKLIYFVKDKIQTKKSSTPPSEPENQDKENEPATI